MKKLIYLFLCLSLSFNLFAHDCSGIAPKNNLWIGTETKNASMTEPEFLAIVAKVEKQYTDVVAAKGGKLVMVNAWDDGTVNAYANQEAGEWQVHMFGGLARHPLTTNDGFALVVCHELGHHLGGAPKYGGSGNQWASNEGEADYWGATKCLKKVLEKEDNIAVVAKMNLDQEAVKKCELVYKSAAEVALCERVSMAGKSLAQLLGSLGGSSNVAFTTPDKTVVKKTFDAHPEAQCRLDTYFSGSLCDKAWSVDVDSIDPKVGVCVKSEGYKVGVRPLCWYKPGQGE
jgi:hypothetical protein